MTANDSPSAAAQRRTGISAGLGAFVLWGIAPVYFKLTVFADILEVLAHRALWSFVFCLILVFALGLGPDLRRAIAGRRNRLMLLGTAILIGGNWWLYVWAVTSGRVLDCSLGYFLNPLVSIAMGVLLLRERLSARQWVAVGLAGAGILVQVVLAGKLPWISVTLAVSFACYGLIRKLVRVESLVGLTMETGYVTPLALGYLLWLGAGAEPALAMTTGSITEILLLLGLGPLTAVPLWLFAIGARKLPLSTVGLMQYVAPSLQFVLAIVWFDEPFSAVQGLSFSLIWMALALYSLDFWRARAP